MDSTRGHLAFEGVCWSSGGSEVDVFDVVGDGVAPGELDEVSELHELDCSRFLAPSKFWCSERGWARIVPNFMGDSPALTASSAVRAGLGRAICCPDSTLPKAA